MFNVAWRTRSGHTFNSCGRCKACVTNHPAYCAEYAQRNFAGKRIDEAEALPVQHLEVAAHEMRLRQRHRQRRVRPRISQVCEALDGDGVVLDALVEQLLGRVAAELVGEIFELDVRPLGLLVGYQFGSAHKPDRDRIADERVFADPL